MGCGQSKIHLYPRKNKSKANGKKSVDVDGEADEEDGHVEERDKEINSEKEKLDEENNGMTNGCSTELGNGEVTTLSLLRKNGSLLQSQEISTSQSNFFRMLEKKIEDGPDYDSASETEMALEEARLNALVHHWESASLTASLCSSTSRSLQGTPVRQAPPIRHSQLRPQFQQPLSAELLSQQQQFIKQQQQQQQLIQNTPNITSSSNLIASNNSPKRDITPTRHNLLSQSIIHQSYGISNSQSPNALNATTRPTNRSLPAQPMGCIQMPYYTQAQPPPQSYFGEILHPLQVPQSQQQPPLQALQPQQQPQLQQQQPLEPRFPPAISVQRLAPQVQRQLRETQELIKDSCSQLYTTGYGSPPSMPALRIQQRGAQRRPTLETQFSQELS